MRTVVVMSGLAVVLVARAAYGDCVYHNGYYDPGLRGACGVETIVPEGCPLHVATPSLEPATLRVFRGMDEVTVQTSDVVVDTISVPMERVDPFDCACSRVAGAGVFDRHEVTVTGAVSGDVVVFDSGQLEGSTEIAIGPAGACPEPAWPTAFTIATQCDLCPIDEADPPADDTAGNGGCASAGGTGSLAVGLLALGLVVVRRRRVNAAA